MNSLIKERFLALTISIPFCDCHIWIGGTNDRGYGKFRWGRMVRAHRASYLLFNGAIPEGLHVLHKCDTPLCVNPKRLFLGTHQDNMADMLQKKRNKIWIGETNSASKLNEVKVLEIRSSTLSTKELAGQYNVHKSAIEKVKARTTWKHV